MMNLNELLKKNELLKYKEAEDFLSELKVKIALRHLQEESATVRSILLQVERAVSTSLADLAKELNLTRKQ